MTHTCHAMGCTRACAPKFLMHRDHWRMVPAKLQRELWAVYVDGQEDRKDPTPEYLVASERCILAVAVKEGKLTADQANQRIARLIASVGAEGQQQMPL